MVDLRDISSFQLLNTKIFRIIILSIFLLSEAKGQGLLNFNYKSAGLENINSNLIQNADHLNEFFEDLYQQRMLNDRKINIIHIGDSHIQGDFMTAVIRRNFQDFFGNAGRGLIIPYSVAGTNEPYNFSTSSPSPWIARRLVERDIQIPLGISGITIRTNDPGASIKIKMKDQWQNYSFNSVKLFTEKTDSAFDFHISDTTHTPLALLKPSGQPEHPHHISASLEDTASTVILKFQKVSERQTHATIFGLSLENGKNGILYHCAGVNGARYEHFHSAEYFTRQTKELTPKLLIISLGTNEAANYPAVDRNFLIHVDKLVSDLRLQNPLAKFILTTPPGAFRKKNKYNPAIEVIRKQIIQYAAENGLAFYDLYKVTGGKDAATRWQQAGLLRPDGIHFTIPGYEYQGELFVDGFIKSYNRYVSVRHQ